LFEFSFNSMTDVPQLEFSGCVIENKGVKEYSCISPFPNSIYPLLVGSNFFGPKSESTPKPSVVKHLRKVR